MKYVFERDVSEMTQREMVDVLYLKRIGDKVYAGILEIEIKNEYDLIQRVVL